MIIGIGTDIINIGRIERVIERNARFVDRIFTPVEIAYCTNKASSAQSYAARFAAKEAVMKALGTGWNGNVNWTDIEVHTQSSGFASILLTGGARQQADNLGVGSIHLSLTHEKEYAVAFVILESI